MTTPVDVLDYAAQAEELVDALEALENTRAPLWAVYGPGGTWEAERKAALSACAIASRLAHNGAKVTEAQIDHEAHTHDAYTKRIDLAAEERTRMALLDAEISAKERRYELAKSRIYLTGRLAGLQ